MSKRTMTLNLTEREMEVLDVLCAKMDLNKTALMRQALRLYQAVDSRLEQQPNVTAKSLFERLQAEHPGEFPGDQLRTLRRRVKQWRQLMAKSLVCVCLDAAMEKGVPSSLLGAIPRPPGF